MDLSKQEAFVRAVDLESLGKAGEELGYSRPGANRMIKSLEEVAGFPPPTRPAGGFQPGREGRVPPPAVREYWTGGAGERLAAALRGPVSGLYTLGSSLCRRKAKRKPLFSIKPPAYSLPSYRLIRKRKEPANTAGFNIEM